MKPMMTAILIAVVLLQQCAFCAGSDTQALERKVSDLDRSVSHLDRRVSNVESVLSDLGDTLVRLRYYRSYRLRQIRKPGQSKEEAAKWAAMSVDEFADVVLDLQDQLEQAKQALDRVRRPPRPTLTTGGDRLQRKKDLLAQIAAQERYDQISTKYNDLRKKYWSAARFLQQKVQEAAAKQASQNAHGAEPKP